MNIRKAIIWALAPAVILAATGCTKKKDTPTAPSPTVTANKICLCTVYRMQSSWSYAFAYGYLFSDPIADSAQSTMSIRWGNHSSRFGVERFVFDGLEFGWYPDSASLLHPDPYNYVLPVGDTAVTVELASNLGGCAGTIRIPDSTFIQSPNAYPGGTDTVAPGAALTVAWAPTANASWYSIWYRAFTIDSNNTWTALPNVEMAVNGTSLAIPPAYYWRPNLRYAQLTISVVPCSGPMPQAGSVGNMTGDNGFFSGILVGQGKSTFKYYYIGASKNGDKAAAFPQPDRRGFVDWYRRMVSAE